MKITIIDSIICKADKELIQHITPCLQYPQVFWKQGPYKRTQKKSIGYFIHKGTGIFLTGLLPKVRDFLFDKKIQYSLEGSLNWIDPDNEPHLKGITLRPDQMKLIGRMEHFHRGIIISPTGSGKTIIALGFMSMFPEAKILFLCHTLDLIDQTIDELKKFGFRNVSKLGSGNKKWKGSRIVVSTIQTFIKLDPEEYCDYFDITIIDEAHHCVDRKGQYGTVMQSNLSPVKIGFTATLPKGQQKLLSMEGLLGPVIGEVTIQEGIDLKIMAKPTITLVSIPYSTKISGHTKYQDLYSKGIVNNRTRNKIISGLVKDRTEEDKTVLIMVKEIVHGENIQKIAKDIYDIDIEFVRGSTDSEARNLTKKLFNQKKIKAVISTAVWREGVNIPTLDCIINAVGGKSEIMTLQAIGRGLRKTDEKDTVEIIDFLDPYRYLAEHCIQRLNVYKNNNWL